MTRHHLFYCAAVAVAASALAGCGKSSDHDSATAASTSAAQTSTPAATQAAPAPAGSSGAAQPMQVAETSSGAATPGQGSAASADAGKAPTYEVKCPEGATSATQCEVGKDTYIGWRTYQANCFVCHGADGRGTTIAPNLMDRFKDHVDYARFKYVITNGFTGQVGAMPAWKDNPNVMPNVDNLYRYLKARTDGVLPPGRPKRMQ